MAPKKQKATAPAVKVPVKKSGVKRASKIPGAKTHDGRPTRAEKSAANKKAYHKILAEESKSLRELMPPAAKTFVHPDGGKKPTEYTDALGELICLRFATDPSFSVLKLNSDPEMPSVLWFYKWLIEYPHLEKCYARARDIQADLQAAELEQWATESLIGRKTLTRSKSTDNGDEETTEVQEYDNIERARLKVQTRQWLLSKYRPRKYGVQPITLETTGDDALSELITQFRERNKELEGA
jgi:hypothetical protein